jgi:3-oxoacyl-[acyl-carrier protein] reductase
MSKLKNKRALVTAGAQGIGLAITRRLLEAGCDVFVHYRTSADAAKKLGDEAKKLGRRYGTGSGDLTTTEECDRIVAEAVKFLGGLDILMNNAGSMVGRRSIAEGDDEFWAEVMSLNLGSMRRVTRAAVPHLAAAAKTGGGASIINLSSLAARNGGGPGALAYATSKGAMLTFTRGLARELGPQGIRVNALTPGLILGSAFHAIHTAPEAQKNIIAGIPLGERIRRLHHRRRARHQRRRAGRMTKAIRRAEPGEADPS